MGAIYVDKGDDVHAPAEQQKNASHPNAHTDEDGKGKNKQARSGWLRGGPAFLPTHLPYFVFVCACFCGFRSSAALRARGPRQPFPHRASP